VCICDKWRRGWYVVYKMSGSATGGKFVTVKNARQTTTTTQTQREPSFYSPRNYVYLDFRIDNSLLGLDLWPVGAWRFGERREVVGSVEVEASTSTDCPVTTSSSETASTGRSAEISDSRSDGTGLHRHKQTLLVLAKYIYMYLSIFIYPGSKKHNVAITADSTVRPQRYWILPEIHKYSK